jgi:hypothetical protein
MAELTRVNGDMGTAGDAQFFGGSKIAFFGMIVKNGSGEAVDMSGEGGVNEAWEGIYKAISAQATPVLFQYESGSSGAASWGIELNGAGWTAATLQTAIRALGADVGANSVDVSGTTVTDVGFKLAVA